MLLGQLFRLPQQRLNAPVPAQIVVTFHASPERLGRRSITVIVPYRDNNKACQYEDGRLLHRYRRRWAIERTFA